MHQVIARLIFKITHPFTKFEYVDSMPTEKGAKTEKRQVFVFRDSKSKTVFLMDVYSGLLSMNIKIVRLDSQGVKYLSSLINKALENSIASVSKNTDTLIYERQQRISRLYKGLAAVIPKNKAIESFPMWSHPIKKWHQPIHYIEISRLPNIDGFKRVEISHIGGNCLIPMGGSWYILSEQGAERFIDVLQNSIVGF